jgi:hypothetical protein
MGKGEKKGKPIDGRRLDDEKRRVRDQGGKISGLVVLESETRRCDALVWSGAGGAAIVAACGTRASLGKFQG